MQYMMGIHSFQHTGDYPCARSLIYVNQQINLGEASKLLKLANCYFFHNNITETEKFTNAVASKSRGTGANFKICSVYTSQLKIHQI